MDHPWGKPLPCPCVAYSSSWAESLESRDEVPRTYDVTEMNMFLYYSDMTAVLFSEITALQTCYTGAISFSMAYSHEIDKLQGRGGGGLHKGRE